MKSKTSLFLVIAGVCFLLLGASFLLGFNELALERGLSCKSICGLGLLFSFFFGQQIGGFVVGGIWAGIGVFLCIIALRKPL